MTNKSMRCRCNHLETEHSVVDFGEHRSHVCNGVAYDQGMNIGCYCSQFIPQTDAYLLEQRRRVNGRFDASYQQQRKAFGWWDALVDFILSLRKR